MNPTPELHLAYCGINCVKCKNFKVKCDGCLTNGRLSKYCLQICKIRPCAIERGLENCAHCPDYDCDKLKITQNWPAKPMDTLDEIRKQLEIQ